MGLIIRNPTTVTQGILGGDNMPNTSPTGHTQVFACAPGCAGLDQPNCRWSGFSNAGLGGATSKRLKYTVTYDGSFDTFPAPASNHILLRNSLNAGSSYGNGGFEVIDFNLGTTVFNENLALPLNQDISQIYVEELLETFQFGSANGAGVHSTVSNIRVEIVILDVGGVWVM